MHTLSPQVSEREIYVRFIQLPVYPSIANKGNRKNRKYIQESRRKGEADFETRDLFYRGMVTKMNYKTVKNKIVSQLLYTKQIEQKFVSLHSWILTNIQGFRGYYICLHISGIHANACRRDFKIGLVGLA